MSHHAIRRSSEAVVTSTPTVTTRPDTALQLLSFLNTALLFLAVVTNEAIMGGLLAIVVMFLLLIWVLGCIGLSGVAGFFLGAMRFGGRSAAREATPTLTFRCQLADSQREVHLRGFDTGIELGDRVRVSGPTFNGTIRAIRVVNETTGAVMRRRGIATLLASAVACAILVAVVISQVV